MSEDKSIQIEDIKKDLSAFSDRVQFIRRSL